MVTDASDAFDCMSRATSEMISDSRPGAPLLCWQSKKGTVVKKKERKREGNSCMTPIRKLIQQNLIPNLATRKVLELGTGTGLVGLVCDLLGAPEVHLTDYHASVLKNVAINVELNKSKAQVSKLDFCQVAAGHDPAWEGRKFDLVIASDLLYEMEHAEHLPVAVEKLMENEFYFMIPLRDTHWDEVNRFEERMSEVGLTLRRTVDIERQDEDAVVVYRYYEFCRASVA